MNRTYLSLLFACVTIILGNESANAQISTDSTTATQVKGNAVFPIGAGTVNGSNLYHSFSRFNVPETGTVFGIGNSSIQGDRITNIINRVTGDTPSTILGTIQSRQAFPNANLYLLNPNGIVFGVNAKLDIGGSFTASTGTAIGFNNGQILEAISSKSSFPNGNPLNIQFGVTQAAGIINQGNLTVPSGQQISLVGGTVISTGELNAQNGRVDILTVDGKHQVELRSPDAILGLRISTNNIASDWTGKITGLPELAGMLTGSVPEAKQVIVKPDGSLGLATGNTFLTTNITVDGKFETVGAMQIDPGDVFIKSLNTGSSQIQAVGNLSLLVPELRASGNLELVANKTLLVRDSLAQPAILQTGGNLLLQGKESIDILALNHPNIKITSLGNLTLASDRIISGDAQYFSGGQFQIRSISGGIPKFVSLYDPIISSIGDVTFGDYTGAALKVESQGSITAGNIIITSPDTGLVGTDPDIPILTSGRAAILRAGVTSLANSPNVPSQIGNTNFASTSATTGGSIDVTSIRTSTTAGSNGGDVIITAPGNITVRNEIVTQVVVGDGTLNETGNAGNVSITSSSGAIAFNGGRILATAAGNGNGGNVTLKAEGNIIGISNVIATDGGASAGNGGVVTISSNTGLIDVGLVVTPSNFNNGGNITLSTNTGSINFALANSEGGTRAGDINILAPQGTVNGTFPFTALDGTTTAVVSAQAGLPLFTTTPLQGGIAGDITIETALGQTPSLAGAVTNKASQVNSAPRIFASNLPLASSNSVPPASNNNSNNNDNVPNTSLPSSPTTSQNSDDTEDVATSSTLSTSNQITGQATLASETNEIAQNQSILSSDINESSSTDVDSSPSSQIAANSSSSSETSNSESASAVTIAASIKQEEAGQFSEKGQLPEAFNALELGNVAEMVAYVGKSVKTSLSEFSINDAQSEISRLSKITDSSSALIYPTILSDRLEILVIPPSGVIFRRSVPAARKEILERTIEQFRSNLLDPSSNDYLKEAKQLYDWVIRPIESELKANQIETLVFVMDGSLRVTPVAAFHDGKQFLVEKYAMANIPSLRLTNLEQRDRSNNRILAMGLSEAVQGFSALPAVEIEIATISSQILPGNSFLNRPFSVENLKTQRSQENYAIVHLATHAQFLRDRDSSFIQFYNERLKIGEIFKLKLDSPRIEMLTLSACQTALGNNMGISGAAIESGAKSVLASLWSVSDAGTAPLMMSFYSYWKEASSKALALQQSQLALLKGKVRFENNKLIGIPGIPDERAMMIPRANRPIDLTHPFYWSSFILVGNWL